MRQERGCKKICGDGDLRRRKRRERDGGSGKGDGRAREAQGEGRAGVEYTIMLTIRDKENTSPSGNSVHEVVGLSRHD